MLTEMAIASMMAGVPVREAVASVVESAMADQSSVCNLICRVTVESAGPAVARWYHETGSKAIMAVRPGVGVGDEVPMSAGAVIDPIYPAEFIVEVSG